MKKIFLAIIALSMLAFAPLSNASPFNALSLSLGAVSGSNGSVMIGYTVGSFTTQFYHNEGAQSGLDVVYATKNDFIVGVGGIQGKNSFLTAAVDNHTGFDTTLVGVVGKKVGNFSVIGRIFNPIASHDLKGNVGAYYTLHFK